jgi:hypothetical protein
MGHCFVNLALEKVTIYCQAILDSNWVTGKLQSSGPSAILIKSPCIAVFLTEAHGRQLHFKQFQTNLKIILIKFIQ